MFDPEQPYKASKLLQDTSTVATQLQHHHFQHFRMPERRLGIKIIIFVVFLIGLVVMLAMCRNNNDIEEGRGMVVPSNKYSHARIFRFHFQIIIEGERVTGNEAVATPYISPGWGDFDPFFDTLIFVHSEEEAQGFPDNVVVAWPVDSEWLQSEIQRLNRRVRRDEDDPLFSRAIGVEALLRDYGLVYPITIVDFVDNWEAVWLAHLDLVLRGHLRR